MSFLDSAILVSDVVNCNVPLTDYQRSPSMASINVFPINPSAKLAR